MTNEQTLIELVEMLLEMPAACSTDEEVKENVRRRFIARTKLKAILPQGTTNHDRSTERSTSSA